MSKAFRAAFHRSCRDEERLRPTHIHRPGGFRRVSHICGAEFQPCESGVPGALRVRDIPSAVIFHADSRPSAE